MRYVTSAGAFVTVVVACLTNGAAVVAEDRPAAAGPTAWRAAPELRPGEIVVRRTGTKRVAARPVPAGKRLAELPYEGAGPRSVTIGYLVRDETETGWGPQVHCPAPSYPRSYSACDSYGYNAYLPSYVPSYGSSCGGGMFFGSRPYSAPAAPVGRAVRWR